jgi:hypothetical protein
MTRNSKISALIAALALSVGVGIAAPAFAQEGTSAQAAAHEKAMKEGKDHAAAQLASPRRSDAVEAMRMRGEHEAAMKRGASHSTAQQATVHRSDADAVIAKAKRHAESMKMGRDHNRAQLDSNETGKGK